MAHSRNHSCIGRLYAQSLWHSAPLCARYLRHITAYHRAVLAFCCSLARLVSLRDLHMPLLGSGTRRKGCPPPLRAPAAVQPARASWLTIFCTGALADQGPTPKCTFDLVTSSTIVPTCANSTLYLAIYAIGPSGTHQQDTA